MTFRQIKSKVRLHQLLLASSMILMIIVTPFIRLMGYNRRMIPDFTMGEIVLSLVTYAVFIAALCTMIYAAKYIFSHTRCLKCKRMIATKTFLKMENFRCPHCGNEKFDNDVAEIWFK